MGDVVVRVLANFILGFAFGAVATGLGFFLLIDQTKVLISIIAIGALVFGILAALFGDRFWEWIKDRWEQIWPWW